MGLTKDPEQEAWKNGLSVAVPTTNSVAVTRAENKDLGQTTGTCTPLFSLIHQPLIPFCLKEVPDLLVFHKVH